MEVHKDTHKWLLLSTYSCGLFFLFSWQVCHRESLPSESETKSTPPMDNNELTFAGMSQDGYSSYILSFAFAMQFNLTDGGLSQYLNCHKCLLPFIQAKYPLMSCHSITQLYYCYCYCVLSQLVSNVGHNIHT